jgi:hypothetical protein
LVHWAREMENGKKEKGQRDTADARTLCFGPKQMAPDKPPSLNL